MRCPSCQRRLERVAEHDAIFVCLCGAAFTGVEVEARARGTQRELGLMADRVCFLIVSSDYPEVDVRIEQAKVRARCEELFPDRMELYEMIYESRFERLWSQFR